MRKKLNFFSIEDIKEDTTGEYINPEIDIDNIDLDKDIVEELEEFKSIDKDEITNIQSDIIKLESLQDILDNNKNINILNRKLINGILGTLYNKRIKINIPSVESFNSDDNEVATYLTIEAIKEELNLASESLKDRIDNLFDKISNFISKNMETNKGITLLIPELQKQLNTLSDNKKSYLIKDYAISAAFKLNKNSDNININNAIKLIESTESEFKHIISTLLYLNELDIKSLDKDPDINKLNEVWKKIYSQLSKSFKNFNIDKPRIYRTNKILNNEYIELELLKSYSIDIYVTNSKFDENINIDLNVLSKEEIKTVLIYLEKEFKDPYNNLNNEFKELNKLRNKFKNRNHYKREEGKILLWCWQIEYLIEKYMYIKTNALRDLFKYVKLSIKEYEKKE